MANELMYVANEERNPLSQRRHCCCSLKVSLYIVGLFTLCIAIAQFIIGCVMTILLLLLFPVGVGLGIVDVIMAVFLLTTSILMMAKSTGKKPKEWPLLLFTISALLSCLLDIAFVAMFSMIVKNSHEKDDNAYHNIFADATIFAVVPSAHLTFMVYAAYVAISALMAIPSSSRRPSRFPQGPNSDSPPLIGAVE